METVAVYCETPVRTYELAAREGCLLLGLECDPAQLAALTALLATLEPPLPLVSCSALWRGEVACLEICLPQDQAPRLEEAAARAGAVLASRREVCVVNLQGPHFGDRWGLAREALAGLEEAGVAPLSCLGATHTLQLTLEPSARQAAIVGLGKRFVAPESRRG
jgi:hypothetical protein